jgi:hypothetical protein
MTALLKTRLQPVAAFIFPASDTEPVAQQFDVLWIDAFAVLCVCSSACNENVGIDAFVQQLMKASQRGAPALLTQLQPPIISSSTQ